MGKREELKEELGQLIEDALELFSLAKKAKTSDILLFGTKYQNWYTRAIKIIETLANDRLEEFISYYKIDSKRKDINVFNYAIQDFVTGRGARRDMYGKDLWNKNAAVATKVYNQLQILQSLDTRIESVLSDVQGALLSELQDKELATAEDLLKINLRAAGSLAGVVLENHLQKVVQNHGISVTKRNPNISDLNDLLKSNGVYDLVTWRNIQLLYDIRTKCAHKKDQEPTEIEVRKLISGVNEAIKEIF
jgi:hypothetical protein